MNTSSQKVKQRIYLLLQLSPPKNPHTLQALPGAMLPIPPVNQATSAADLLMFGKMDEPNKVLLSVPKIYFPAAEKDFPAPEGAMVVPSPKRCR